MQNRIGAAEAALVAGNSDRARAYLHEIPPADQASIAYQLTDAKVLMAEHQLPQAEANIEKILRLDPNNEEAKFQLDVIRLANPNSPGHFGALVNMRKLAEGKGPRATGALRLMVRSEAADGELLAAASDAAELVKRPDATAVDRIVLVDLAFGTSSFDLQNSIASLREWALANPDSLAPVVNYLIGRGLGGETLKWLRSTAGDRKNAPPVRDALLALAQNQRDWDLVFEILGSGEQAIPANVLTKLKNAQRAFREDRSDAGWQWDALLESADDNLFELSTFEQLTQAWGWSDARKKTLYKIAKIIPSNPQVWRLLFAFALEDRSAPEIANVLTSLVAVDPTSRQMSDTWIRFQILLDRGNKADLVSVAKTNLDLSPKVPAFQLTYALTLASADRGSEALAVLEAMDPDARSEAAAAGPYVAYVYAKGGRSAEAKAALDRMQAKSATLLPEELTLANRAQALAEGRAERVQIAPEADQRGAEAMLKELQKEQIKESDRSGEVLKELIRQKAKDDRGAVQQLKELQSELHSNSDETKPK